ncbi:hypothetical protein EJ03DRAFT_18398 [Teratosphaeria nubilosa]|uniref:Uncharacterized protein n=1 Tax=Teratosphaeria nubilosa TaxID=161662 RepID=A0A6G1KVK6_9PEZI|nr:hypothetical protein EJ03DRAFT_18398 [Teratosphaeria nubilosa]
MEWKFRSCLRYFRDRNGIFWGCVRRRHLAGMMSVARGGAFVCAFEHGEVMLWFTWQGCAAFQSGTLVLQDANVQAAVLDAGKREYQPQISCKKQQ